MINAALSALNAYRVANLEAESFYEGTFTAEQFGISIPPSMQGVQTPTGWGGTVVDSLEERLDWQGWHTEQADDYGLGEVYDDNQLDVDSGLTHLDSLIFGTSFVAGGTGFEGEPSPLITPHSPFTLTGNWDRRLRRLREAVAIDPQNKRVTLYVFGETATFELRDGNKWVVVDRDQHRMPRLPVVMFPNRVRGSRDTGRSEITRAVRYYCEAAARTMLGMEVSREFYNAPKLVALNLTEKAFQSEDGTPANQWTAVQGRIWYAPPNEEGEAAPDVKQISASSPMPYLDQIKGYATYVASEAGIPVSHFGFSTENPPSADAIRAVESRHVKRAERRQTIFGRSWLEVGAVALMVRDGEVPDTYWREMTSKWRDAATPTRAASADEATKLIGAGVLTADSSVTYDRVGLSAAEQRQVSADKRRAGGSAALRAITDAAAAGQPAVG